MTMTCFGKCTFTSNEWRTCHIYMDPNPNWGAGGGGANVRAMYGTLVHTTPYREGRWKNIAPWPKSGTATPFLYLCYRLMIPPPRKNTFQCGIKSILLPVSADGVGISGVYVDGNVNAKYGFYDYVLYYVLVWSHLFGPIFFDPVIFISKFGSGTSKSTPWRSQNLISMNFMKIHKNHGSAQILPPWGGHFFAIRSQNREPMETSRGLEQTERKK